MQTKRMIALMAAAVVVALATSAAAKKKDRSKFVDAKHRFALKMPHGWELAPMPGDLHGMMFRRSIGDVRGIFRAHVEKARDSDTLESACSRLTSSFRGEIGYQKRTDLPTKVGQFTALRRTHIAYALGDKRIIRYAVDTVFFAYGYIHFLHFETLESAYSSFKSDLNKLTKNYRPMIGRKVYAPLIGEWELVGSSQGLKLKLNANLTYRLGSKQGSYRATKKRLTFIGDDGRETFDYTLGDASLVVRNDNLSSPMAYRRVGEAAPSLTAVDGGKKNRSLVGTWRVIDGDIELRLSPSGSVQFGPLSGRYQVKGKLLTIKSAAGVEMTYHYSMHAGRLTLSGGDLERPLAMERK